MGVSKLASLDMNDAENQMAYGNKIANLARAFGSGLGVPPGVCISWEASERELLAELPSLMDSIAPPWVARSSSIVEDSVARTFAGLFETVLGIDTMGELYEAIDSVRRSGSTHAVDQYVGGTRWLPMGVLIQPLINAKVAGVAFTRDPATSRAVVLVESSFGLGKAVVDGAVIPDLYEFDLDGRAITTRVATKRTRYDYADGIVSETAVELFERALPTLSAAESERVFLLAKRCEDLFGYPVDVEWAIDQHDELWLLQSRPITTGAADLPEG